MSAMFRWFFGKSALEGIRTPNLLIRSQMLYPLSYKRQLSKMNTTCRGAGAQN